MQCPRCAGLRVPEIIYEGGSRVLALRCVHCGDVVDRVIVLNRQRCRIQNHAEAKRPSNIQVRQVCGFNSRRRF